MVVRGRAVEEMNLFDGAQTPHEANKGNNRVQVETELCKGSTSAGQHGNQAIDAGDLVEDLFTGQMRGGEMRDGIHRQRRGGRR